MAAYLIYQKIPSPDEDKAFLFLVYQVTHSTSKEIMQAREQTSRSYLP